MLFDEQRRNLLTHLERVLVIREPSRGILHDELDLGAQREGEVRHLVSGREIHENGYVQVGNEVEQKILELILLGAVDRELAKDDSTDVTQ